MNFSIYLYVQFQTRTIEIGNEMAKRLLDMFDSLQEQERQEVAREILRRTALAEHAPLEDAELLTLADGVFRVLDQAERPR